MNRILAGYGYLLITVKMHGRTRKIEKKYDWPQSDFHRWIIIFLIFCYDSHGCKCYLQPGLIQLSPVAVYRNSPKYVLRLEFFSLPRASSSVGLLHFIAMTILNQTKAVISSTSPNIWWIILLHWFDKLPNSPAVCRSKWQRYSVFSSRLDAGLNLTCRVAPADELLLVTVDRCNAKK